MNRNKKTVFVGMSGGVDSSVTALMLKNRDYNVVGVFMRCYNIDGCAETDAEDARRVAGQLGIPFYVWDFEEEYKKRVVEYMVQGYRDGLTPNPDVECNREIKFGLFFDRARRMGADYVATGHYVRLKGKKLYVARDKNKDQSYFLWTLKEDQLAHCLFPIGDYVKSKVRAIAKRAGLQTAEKKDSQGICFLGKVSVADFLKNYIPTREGQIVTTDGQRIGSHEGAYFYTIGQRHGLNLNDKKQITKNKEAVRAHYVAAKDVEKNIITIAEGDDHPALYQQKINLHQINFLNKKLMDNSIQVFARVRYRQPMSAAILKKVDEKELRYQLVFSTPQKFVASGQSAVFYVEERNPSRSSGRRSHELRMLGGGIIE